MNRPRLWWPWVLLALGVLFVAIVAAGAASVAEAVNAWPGGITVHVDGERVFSLPRGEAAGWAAAAVIAACLVMLVLVPLIVVLAVLAAVSAAVLAVGATAVGVLVVAAVVLSPLWLIAFVLWLALRRPATQPRVGAPGTPAAAKA